MINLTPILALFAVAVLAVFAAFWFARSIVDARRARVREFGDDDEPGLLTLPELKEPRTFAQRLDRQFDDLVTDTGLGMSSSQALGYIALVGVVCAAIPLIFRGDLVLAGFAMLLGVLAAMVYFIIQRYRYRERVQDQLPDAFFLMARSLRAGLNLEQSMDTVASYGTQPLAGEFKRVTDRVHLGLNPPVALAGMARRLRMTDFNILVTAVTLHRTVGGNLAALLERVATAVRDRNLFRGYFRAATALGRTTAFAIALAPLLLLIGYAIWQPDFIARFTASASGIRALVIVALLEIIGVIWLLLLLRIDY